MDPLELLRELVAIPGPPGEEFRVREALRRHVEALGLSHRTDAKGNLLVGPADANIVVTAHMDEIAMIVRTVSADGCIKVGPLGGIFAWKLGEGPVQILAPNGAIDGVLGFGSVHTEDPAAVVRQADEGPVKWEMADVFTGMSGEELTQAGVRPGTRVVVHPSRRGLMTLGDRVAGYFLDDRADLVSWLLMLERFKEEPVLFAATAAEEVGGEGALFLLNRVRPDICIALELAPSVPDAPIEISAAPSVWVTDSYSSMQAADGELVAQVARENGIGIQWQALSRGGSDASCAASHGHCARPFTFGLPMENSHGYEIMHAGAMEQLSRLASAVLEHLLQDGSE